MFIYLFTYHLFIYHSVIHLSISLFDYFFLFRALLFSPDKISNTPHSTTQTQNARETFSCFLSFPIEIYRLTPFSVNLSLHIPFLFPEIHENFKNLFPLGFGLHSEEHSSENSGERFQPCGGILELYESVFSLDEVSYWELTLHIYLSLYSLIYLLLMIYLLLLVYFFVFVFVYFLFFIFSFCCVFYS